MQAVPLNHDELLSRCSVHLVYLGFGIFLELKWQPPLDPIVQITQLVLGTIISHNKAMLNTLVTQGVTGTTADPLPMPKVKLEDNSSNTVVPGNISVPVQGKPKATAAAGSAAQLPRVQAELQDNTSAAR